MQSHRYPQTLSIITLCGLLSLTACKSNNNASAISTQKNERISEPPAVATPPSSLPLKNGASSREKLVEIILTGLAQSDTATLRDILITQEEFDAILYPELGIHYPTANDNRPETRRFLWQNQFIRSAKSLEKALNSLGGKTMEPIGIKHTEGIKEYITYTMYEGTVVRVRREDGREADLTALGTIVRKDSVYKLLSYRDL